MSDILNILKAEGSFTTLLSLLEQAGMSDRLAQPGPFTFFAPNDDAFQRVKVEVISKDPRVLLDLLKYHLIAGEHSSDDIALNQHLVTTSGKSLSLSKSEGRQVIDNAQFVATDIRCGNGIIHVIDNVFLPEFSGWYCGGCC
jgi:uncharacterized surface protein with fasciclin (FAS1) repeats